MFANRIKNLRRSKELNQVQLAEKLGVKKQSISNWENDNIMPSIDMLIRIADFFHVSTDYLLGRDVQEVSAPAVLDLTGLTPRQIEHIQFIVDDLRENEH
jgi:transcriptional regulator with XRE-family HTH domain